MTVSSPFFTGTHLRVNGDTYLCDPDNTPTTELHARLSFTLTHFGNPRLEPVKLVRCFYENDQIIITGPTIYHKCLCL